MISILLSSEDIYRLLLYYRDIIDITNWFIPCECITVDDKRHCFDRKMSLSKFICTLCELPQCIPWCWPIGAQSAFPWKSQVSYTPLRTPLFVFILALPFWWHHAGRDGKLWLVMDQCVVMSLGKVMARKKTEQCCPQCNSASRVDRLSSETLPTPVLKKKKKEKKKWNQCVLLKNVHVSKAGVHGKPFTNVHYIHTPGQQILPHTCAAAASQGPTSPARYYGWGRGM